MKDQELVELWGGDPNMLFNKHAQDDWTQERWKNIWGKHKLLPSTIRHIIEQEVNNDP